MQLDNKLGDKKWVGEEAEDVNIKMKTNNIIDRTLKHLLGDTYSKNDEDVCEKCGKQTKVLYKVHDDIEGKKALCKNCFSEDRPERYVGRTSWRKIK